MSPVPLLFLDHAPGLGGAEQSLLLLLKYLDRSRWQPHLACVGGPLAERAAALSVAVHCLPMPRLRRSPWALADWLRGACAITRLARQVNARALVANTVRTALYAAPAARLAHTSFIWYMRDFWLSEARPRHPWADRMGKRLLCTAARQVIANSYATAAHLPCNSKVAVVYNGIEIEQYDIAMDGKPFRRQYGIPYEASLIGMVGRLRPWKGQERFIRMLARLREESPDVWGVVVGGTPFGSEDGYPQRLKQLAARLELADHLVFTGHLEDIRPALAAMDVFVHPGDPEPFGLVNIEAMAMGKPVVAFAHGALPEIVADGETGVLIPPWDEEAMGRAILSLLEARERRQALGAAGRERVQRMFTAAKMAGEIAALLERVLS